MTKLLTRFKNNLEDADAEFFMSHIRHGESESQVNRSETAQISEGPVIRLNRPSLYDGSTPEERR